MSQATDQLIHRVERALGTHDVHPEDRAAILDALVPDITWETLPADVQQLILDAEGLAQQSWDDPADVPAEVLDATGVDDSLVQENGRRGPYVQIAATAPLHSGGAGADVDED